jgi:Flp pilus assembly protein TadG
MTRPHPLLQRSAERGQAVPEFALVAPVLFLILFAIIQFGFTLSGQIGFTNGVREAARYASTLPTATVTAIEAELRTRSLPKSIPGFADSNFDGAATTVTYCAYTNPDNVAVTSPSYSIKVRVTAVYRHPLLLPLVSAIVDAADGTNDGHLKAVVTEEMRVENPRLTSAGGLPLCP